MMLLSRLLPPQFLLPSRRARQLLRGERRRYSHEDNGPNSGPKGSKSPQDKRLFRKHIALRGKNQPLNPRRRDLPGDNGNQNYWQARTNGWDKEKYNVPRTGVSTPQETTKATSKRELRQGLEPEKPLFEELFPEMSQQKTPDNKKQTPWLPISSIGSRDSGVPSLSDVQTLSSTVPKPAQGSVRRETELGPNIGFLVFSRAYGTLAESDFYRASPQGFHIEGWVGGITKIIPCRNPRTLNRTGSYILCFRDRNAARAYRDNLLNYFKIARTATPLSLDSPLPPPHPSAITNGLSPTEVAKSFTLVPPSQGSLMIRDSIPSYSKLNEVIYNGGYQAIIRAQDTGSAQGKAGVVKLRIVPAVDGAHSQWGIRKFIQHDGWARDLKWNLCQGEDAIRQLVQVKDKEILDEEDPEVVKEILRERQGRQSMAIDWVIAFTDMVEARRFVRTWHRREWPDYQRKVEKKMKMRAMGVVEEQPAMINAEVLW